MKHLEVRQKYSAAPCIFNSLLSVSSGDEMLHLMLDNYIIWKTVKKSQHISYEVVKILYVHK